MAKECKGCECDCGEETFDPVFEVVEQEIKDAKAIIKGGKGFYFFDPDNKLTGPFKTKKQADKKVETICKQLKKEMEE